MPAKPELTQIEKDKLSIDPDFDFREIAQRPFDDITTNEIGMFKWSGVYHQLQPGFFMIRWRIPGGMVSAGQLDRAAHVAERFGQGRLCLTTRQCLQFHWLRREDIYKVIEAMEAVGIDSRNACGDVVRNVVTCPLAGVCPHEIADTRTMLLAIANDDELLNEQRNLPRKHKIIVAGCGRACGQTLIGCQGWYPVQRQRGEGIETGWKYHAGGGLGARPRIASVIFDWVPEDLVLEVTRATVEAYRRHGGRRKRGYARVKLVVEEMTAAGFGRCVLDILHERGVDGLERIELAQSADANVDESFLDGQSIIRQKNGDYAVRIVVRRGELSTVQAWRLSRWARQYADGQVMISNRQNIILRNVPEAAKERLLGEIRLADFDIGGNEHLPDAVACVGSTVCPLAVSDTPDIYRNIVTELAADEDWWRDIGPLSIHMNGCPNSCGQHATADIGLRGTRRTGEVGSDEAYSIYVGGSFSGKGRLAEYLCDVPTGHVVTTLRRLLNLYLQQRDGPQERFAPFAQRVGAESIRESLGTTASAFPLNARNLALAPILDAVVRQALERDAQHRSNPSEPAYSMNLERLSPTEQFQGSREEVGHG